MKYISTFKQNKIRENPEYANLLLEHFDTFYLAGCGMNTPSPERLQQYYDGLDFLVSRDKSVIGHTLFCFTKKYQQNIHLKDILRKSFSEQEEALESYLREILNATRGKITDWYVFNECSRRKNLAQIIYGYNFVDPIVNMIHNIDPSLNLRINEYGYQNPNIVNSLIDLSKNPKLGIGMQVYCTNPFFHIKLEHCLQQIRDKYPDRDLFLSEISVMDSKLLSRSMYKHIKRLAEKYNVKEIGFWWPTDLYTEKSWSRKSVGLWDENLSPTKNYSLFF